MAKSHPVDTTSATYRLSQPARGTVLQFRRALQPSGEGMQAMTAQEHVRDALIRQCMQLPVASRFLVLAAVWEHVVLHRTLLSDHVYSAYARLSSRKHEGVAFAVYHLVGQCMQLPVASRFLVLAAAWEHVVLHETRARLKGGAR